MKAESAYKTRFWYGIFLGVFTVAMGILFIVEAADIYYADPNGNPYSYEVVGEHLKTVLIPAILWLIAVIAGFVLSVIWPVAAKKRHKADDRAIIKRLKARVPAEGTDSFADRKKLYDKLTIVKIILWSVCAAFAIAAAAVSIAYLADVSHFPANDITGSMIKMLRSVLPWIGTAFMLFIVVTLYEHFSAKRELRLIKELIVLGKGNHAKEPTAALSRANAVLAVLGSEKSILIIRLAVLAAGLTFLIWGVLNGGASDVLIKAINICTECIGLG